MCVQVFQDIKKDKFISTWHAEARDWVVQGECEPRIKFGLTGYIDILGHTWIDKVTFSDGESFAWSKVSMPSTRH